MVRRLAPVPFLQKHFGHRFWSSKPRRKEVDTQQNERAELTDNNDSNDDLQIVSVVGVRRRSSSVSELIRLRSLLKPLPSSSSESDLSYTEKKTVMKVYLRESDNQRERLISTHPRWSDVQEIFCQIQEDMKKANLIKPNNEENLNEEQIRLRYSKALEKRNLLLRSMINIFHIQNFMYHDTWMLICREILTHLAVAIGSSNLNKDRDTRMAVSLLNGAIRMCQYDKRSHSLKINFLMELGRYNEALEAANIAMKYCGRMSFMNKYRECINILKANAPLKLHYRTLGLCRNFTEHELQAAYRKKAAELHPDKHRGEEEQKFTKLFQELGEAYETLRCPEKRKMYDDEEENILIPEYLQAQEEEDETYDNPLNLEASIAEFQEKIKRLRTIEAAEEDRLSREVKPPKKKRRKWSRRY